MLENFKRRQEPVLNCLFKIVVGCRQLPLAPEQAERVARHEVDRRRGQADLKAVEVVEHVSIDIVDASM